MIRCTRICATISPPRVWTRWSLCVTNRGRDFGAEQRVEAQGVFDAKEILWNL